MEGRREERQERGGVGRGVEGEEEKYHAIIGLFAADSTPPPPREFVLLRCVAVSVDHLCCAEWQGTRA